VRGASRCSFAGRLRCRERRHGSHGLINRHVPREMQRLAPGIASD